MSKKGNSQKRSIDRLRDGAGSLEIKTPDDDSAITGMISFGDNLLVVKEKGIYAIKLVKGSNLRLTVACYFDIDTLCPGH